MDLATRGRKHTLPVVHQVTKTNVMFALALRSIRNSKDSSLPSRLIADAWHVFGSELQIELAAA